MTLDKRTADVLARELAQRSAERAQRIADANERFDRLVRSGAVRPDRYNLAPINPISMHTGHITE
ncbi:hypothetical protein D3C77_456240 [compost metagenome]